MSNDLEKLDIIHNEADHAFEVSVDGLLSRLNYMQEGKNFVITHVGVHPALRGQGIAGKIVEAGLQYARENSFRVIPMCSYAAAYIRRNPQHRELTEQERGQ